MNKLLKSALSLAMALALMFSLGTAAFAKEWNIEDGNITIDAEAGQEQTVTQGSADPVNDSAPTITGSSTTYTVTIEAGAGATANVTLNNVNIDTSGVTDGSAAITVKGEGAVNIELDGDNTVKSASGHAGIETQSSGESAKLTISDNNKAENGKDASLNATGGENGAGIGGASFTDNEEGAKNLNGDNIKITGGNITAQGGYNAAGIGGGKDTSGSNITISGGTVNANGGDYGAGIGGGSEGNGDKITISDGDVTAIGGKGAAGIGGGDDGGNGTDIHITGGKVTATGGSYDPTDGSKGGAGIGGGAGYKGSVGSASNITISNATVNATGGNGAAGIGGGASNYADGNSYVGTCGDVKISGNANVTATGGKSVTIGELKFAAGTAIGNGSTTTTGSSATLDTTGLTGKVVLKNEDGTLNETIGDKPETPAGDSSSTGDSSATDSSSATSATLISMDTTSPDASPLPVRYYVVTGAEQTWLADSEDGLEFTLNSDSVNVLKVLIDGEEVEFEINDNGGIVISAEVLQALESGAHEIEFVFSDGSCKANFTVK